MDARKRAYDPGIHRKKRFIEEDGLRGWVGQWRHESKKQT